MKLAYTSRALADIDIAMEWYDMQRKGLGGEFLDCLELVIQNILDNPESFAVRYKNVRGGVLRKFPYTVFYTIESKAIIVHAVFHSRLAPSKKP